MITATWAYPGRGQLVWWIRIEELIDSPELEFKEDFFIWIRVLKLSNNENRLRAWHVVDMTFIAFLIIIDLFDTVASMEQSDLYVSRLHLDDLDHVTIRKLCQLDFIATGFS